MDHFKSILSSNSVAGQQHFPMTKLEGNSEHDLSMLNNNHLHVHPTSSHYISDLYMVKRHFNEVIAEHNPNHQQIPHHHQASPNNSGKSLSDEMRCVKRTHDRFPVSNHVPTAVRRNGRESQDRFPASNHVPTAVRRNERESQDRFPASNHVPTAVRRNERERNRVKMVNLGFSTLRQHVPNGAKNKKMSKVETLRSAVDYIKQLQKVLGEGSLDVSSTTSSSGSPLEECYNMSGNCSGMEGTSSCSPMSSSCSPRPSVLMDGAHSSSPSDGRSGEGDRGGEGDISFSDSDHHRYNSSHDDDIMDSLKWY